MYQLRGQHDIRSIKDIYSILKSSTRVDEFKNLKLTNFDYDKINEKSDFTLQSYLVDIYANLENIKDLFLEKNLPKEEAISKYNEVYDQKYIAKDTVEETPVIAVVEKSIEAIDAKPVVNDPNVKYVTIRGMQVPIRI
jgi:hypothetical protein